MSNNHLKICLIVALGVIVWLAAKKKPCVSSTISFSDPEE